MSTEQARTFGRQVWFHRDHVRARHILFWLAFGLAWAMMALPPARYLFLGVPVLVLMVMIGDAGGRITEEALPFLALVAMGFIMAPLNNKDGVKDLYLTFCGLSITFLKDMPRIKLWHVMAALVSAFFVLNAITGGFTNFQFDFMNSLSTLEGGSSFVFAILVPLAVMRKRYALAILAMVFTILTLKRIAILGALVGVFLAVLGERRGGKFLLSWPVMLVANVLALSTIMAYSYGFFDTVITEWTGQSPNQFGQGRYVLQSAVVRELLAEPWKFILGQGAGKVYDMTQVSVWMEDAKTLLHCDSMKLLYEFGVIFWVVFFWAMYRVKSYGAKIAFVVFNVILMTDNVLSYDFFVYYLLVIIHAFKVEASTPTTT